MEESKLLKLIEIRNDIDQKPDCPICRKTNIYLEKRQKKKVKPMRRRREKGKGSSANESQEDNFSSFDETTPSAAPSIELPNEEEIKQRNLSLYKHKLGAFDDDYNASMPTIIFR